MKNQTEITLKQAGYIRKEETDYDSDNDSWFVKSVSYVAPDGVEMDMSQALDEVKRGAAVVRAEISGRAAALAEKRAARAAAEAAALAERARVGVLPAYAGDRNLPFVKTHEGKGFAVCSAPVEGGTVYAIQDTVTWYAEYRFEAAVVETPAAQPEPTQPVVTETQETQEEETDMNDFDRYAQDRQDGEAQEKREDAIFNSIAADANTAPQTVGDPNSDLTAIIAADDADAADEAAMRATYAPAGDPNSDLTAIVAADEAETVYVRDWLTDTPQSNGEAFVKTNRPDGLRWVADRIPDGGIAIGRYNNVGYGPELPEGDWRPVQVASLRWYAVDDE